VGGAGSERTGRDVKPKVYLETTVPSLLTARPSRDVLIAGQWDERRQHYQLFISGLVLAESRRGDRVAAQSREKALAEYRVLEYTEAA